MKKEKKDSATNRPRISLSADEMRQLGYRVIDILVDHFANLEGRPVGQKGDPAKLLPLFSQDPPETGRDVNDLLARLEHEVFPNNLHVDHPRFFAFVPGPNNFVSTMADALAAGFNIFNGTWFGGSAAAAVELGVVRWLCRTCGLPDTAGGLFVSGGSMANLTALVAARNAFLQDRIEGATVYFSDQTHSSVQRALHVIGFSREQIRKLPSDENFRLPIRAMREAIKADRANGLRPFCIVANAGTTNTGAIDPLIELSELAKTEKIWLHVDGAFGAAAVLSERGRTLLQGIERADSISLDPHKWLFQSFECGCVLVRDVARLKAAFQIKADYLRDVHRNEVEFNPGDHGVQLSRSFRALKVWLSLQTFGLSAFRDAITRGFELAEIAERELRKRPGWEILSPAQMATVCFRFGDRDDLQSQLVDVMMRDGFALLTSTTLRGAASLRLCTINPRTTEQDIVETVARLDKFAREG
ncbi:MAG TPA: aminotransferase class I/II-fold pyridoxal phosphate-dependent enzyme [Chthoniobacterales bacterium]|nr:aminotransferase class I/II-fold pyridoxal phosphate-dependent enzyme [Chthoniobacterales bacterium]